VKDIGTFDHAPELKALLAPTIGRDKFKAHSPAVPPGMSTEPCRVRASTAPIEALAMADGSVGWCAMIGCDGGYI
jgi:hypothetical protein